ncbi:MAG: hypothetical protein HKN48_01790 [Flavobacteriaceae bacterium]|nr:hypothetical protein [Flavobacteriaceae bacterium]
MLPSIKNEGGANSKVPSKREEKKRINIRWNSSLAFQLGLIFSMLLVFLVMESTWGLSSTAFYKPSKEIDLTEISNDRYVVEVTTPNKEIEVEKVVKKREVKPSVASNNFKTVVNSDPTPETPVAPTDVEPVKPKKKFEKPVEPRRNIRANINEVEVVPIFPGCESLSTNEERKQCLASKISAHIGRKFDTEKFAEKYSGEKQVINVQFTIDDTGNVVDVLARAPGDDLEVEAKRVISKLPKMQPGRQYNQTVNVVYRIPIVFRVDY